MTHSSTPSTLKRLARRSQPLGLSLGLCALLGLTACGDDLASTFEANPEANNFYNNTANNAAADEEAPAINPDTLEETPTFNEFIDTAEDNLATFSIDVDTASYTLMRRMVLDGSLPSPAQVRTEEYINFFKYDYPTPQPGSVEPFSINLEAAPSRFGEDLHLLRVGIKGLEIPAEERAPTNLVFLVDVSGSMSSSNKLGLVKFALQTLTNSLRPEDTLSIVTYAGADRVVLEPTPVGDRAAVLQAIEDLIAGGGTNGAAGIDTAYELAEGAFIEGGVNRVVLCTDGDFNVGITDEPLVQLVESWRDRDITLSVLGFGAGFNDSFLEELTNRGNGNYAFIDSRNEALRVLGDNLVGTLQVIAKDVKIQIALNAETVTRYRLIGYENRVLNDEDFDNDAIDAGEIGSGHSVTAYLEVELVEGVTPGDEAGLLAEVQVRHKKPDQDVSELSSEVLQIADMRDDFGAATADFRFAAAVAEFAEILRHSPHSEGDDFDGVYDTAFEALGEIPANDRGEFLELISLARDLHTTDNDGQ